MNEQHAIHLCLKHRDPVGFEYFFKKYRKRAYFHAISLLGNPEDAIDACQESFTRAYQAIPGLDHRTVMSRLYHARKAFGREYAEPMETDDPRKEG